MFDFPLLSLLGRGFKEKVMTKTEQHILDSLLSSSQEARDYARIVLGVEKKKKLKPTTEQIRAKIEARTIELHF